MEHLQQAYETLDFPYGLTEGEIKEGVHIKFFEEGYFKYKVNEWFWVHAIYVKKSFREQGTGTRFMSEAEALAKSLGKTVVKLDATTDGKSDILGRFLTKLGYKDSGNYIWYKNI